MGQNFEKLVIDTLTELKKDIQGLKKQERVSTDKISEEISKLKVDIATMKVKASLLGGIGGLISIAIMLAVNYLSGR